ncbi:MAG: hypothetical protein M1127_03570 [Patescibacteria group bacterium]|nr:hypothetical protein [Patescibacteria group bacterium]
MPLVKKTQGFVFACCFIAAFFVWSFFAFAQNEEDCSMDKIEQAETAFTRDDYQALLEKCKKFYEDKTKEMEKSVGKTAAEKKELASAIAGLKSKIGGIDKKISQANSMIKDLTAQIQNTQTSIEKTIGQIGEMQRRLGNLLQMRQEEDKKSTLEILLADGTLSGSFDDLMALESINVNVQDLLKDVKKLETNLESQKSDMDSEKKSLENVVVAQMLSKKETTKQRQEQEKLLQFTEKEYQKYLSEQKDAKEKATKIGNLLFALLEVPEGGIQFEDAVALAKSTAGQVGVRPAFSLAILWQETRIGQLKGGCYLKNASTGDGVYIKSGNSAPKTMSPTRDVPVFLSLVSSLQGLNYLKTDAFSTPVSCCMFKDGKPYGWGGAMGPAQFIPSTWALYADELEKVSGHVASPWNIKDSFFANAIYLKDLGAGAQNYDRELNAALRYFGCSNTWCKTNYGRPVMAAANCFQDYMEKNEMSAACRDLIF